MPGFNLLSTWQPGEEVGTAPFVLGRWGLHSISQCRGSATIYRGNWNIHPDPCCVPGSQVFSIKALILAWQTCWTSDCLWALQYCLEMLLSWVSLWAIKASLWLPQLAFNCSSKALSFSQTGSYHILCRASAQRSSNQLLQPLPLPTHNFQFFLLGYFLWSSLVKGWASRPPPCAGDYHITQDGGTLFAFWAVRKPVSQTRLICFLRPLLAPLG